MSDGSSTMFLGTTRAAGSGWPFLLGNNTYKKRINRCTSIWSPSDHGPHQITTSESLSLQVEPRKRSGHRTTPRSNAPLIPGKTVGIIGGASVFSTLVFLEKIAWWSSKDGDETVPFVVCNDPVLNPPRRDLSRFLDSNRIEITDNLRKKRLFLEEAGAGCIVMPCHSLHVWHKEVSEGCKLPFLHVGECVSQELTRANLRPLEAGGSARIGILGTDSVLMARTYQENLERQGLEAVLPDKQTVEHLVVPAIEASQRKDIEGARNLLRIAIQVLLIRAVNVVVIASDEMQGLLPRDDPLLKKCIDPMDSLARSAIQCVKSQ